MRAPKSEHLKAKPEPKSIECNHTLAHQTESGRWLGSWHRVQRDSLTCVECVSCKLPYEEHAKLTKQIEEEQARALEEAYRIQQQRLSCPGCGEEPFLG